MKINTRSWLFRTLSLSFLAAIALAFVTSAEAVAFTYSNTAGSSILFPGDGTFSFAPAANNLKITSGTASGFLGEITGTFSIGAITTVGPVSMAPVTGTGAFDISDGTFDLTGTLNWLDMQQIGTGNSLNISGQVNMTGITYSGTNPDLVALASVGSAINTLTFQFTPAVSLSTLKNGPGPNSTSFSGNVATLPDGGSTVGLLGLALLGVGFIHRRIKSLSA
jgi:hypothetical protein